MVTLRRTLGHIVYGRRTRQTGLLTAGAVLLLALAPVTGAGLQGPGRRAAVPTLRTAARPTTAQPVASTPSTTAPSRSGKLRHGLTPQQRLERLLAQTRYEDPVLPLVMYGIERHLQGTTSNSEVDRVVAGVLRNHPQVSRQTLQKLVDNWHAVSAGTKQRIVPRELQGLRPTQEIDPRVLRSMGSRLAAQAALTDPRPLPGMTPPTPARRIPRISVPTTPRDLPSTRVQPLAWRQHAAGPAADWYALSTASAWRAGPAVLHTPSLAETLSPGVVRTSSPTAIPIDPGWLAERRTREMCWERGLPYIGHVGIRDEQTGRLFTDANGQNVVALGEKFQVGGFGFSQAANENRIIIKTNQEPPSSVTTLTPTSFSLASPLLLPPPPHAPGDIHTLEAIAPGGMTAGEYRVSVEVNGEPSFNYRLTSFATPGPPAISFEPVAAHQGDLVPINGGPFWQDLQLNWVPTLQHMQGYAPNPSVATYENPVQLKMIVPNDMFPTSYVIQTMAAGVQTASELVGFTVQPFKYTLKFQSMICDDESDWESPGDDEVLTVWHVYCDDDWSDKTSAEYDNFSDGVSKPFSAADAVVYQSGDAPHEGVRSYLIFSASMWEVDTGDAQDVAEAVATASEIAAAMLPIIAATAEVPVLGQVAAAVEAVGTLVACFIVAFCDAPDPLGTQVDAYLADDLRAMTTDWTGVSPLVTLVFKNNDDVGSYRLTYKVMRSLAPAQQ